MPGQNSTTPLHMAAFYNKANLVQVNLMVLANINSCNIATHDTS
jgi:ankyrin repeat protein